MDICPACRDLTARNFQEHGDERLPPVACDGCGRPTSSGACLLMTLCAECARSRNACPACGKTKEAT